MIGWIKKIFFKKEADILEHLEDEREDTDNRNKDLGAVFAKAKNELHAVLHDYDQDKDKH
jgi:hypothetical protein